MSSLHTDRVKGLQPLLDMEIGWVTHNPVYVQLRFDMFSSPKCLFPHRSVLIFSISFGLFSISGNSGPRGLGWKRQTDTLPHSSFVWNVFTVAIFMVKM